MTHDEEAEQYAGELQAVVVTSVPESELRSRGFEPTPSPDLLPDLLRIWRLKCVGTKISEKLKQQNEMQKSWLESSGTLTN